MDLYYILVDIILGNLIFMMLLGFSGWYFALVWLWFTKGMRIKDQIFLMIVFITAMILSLIVLIIACIITTPASEISIQSFAYAPGGAIGGFIGGQVTVHKIHAGMIERGDRIL